jgi:hypothetical protein
MLHSRYLHRQLKLPRRTGWTWVLENSLHTIVREDLYLLCHAGGELAASLHSRQQSLGDTTFAERISQQARSLLP